MKNVDMIFDGNSLYARAFWANNRDSTDHDMTIRSCLLTVFSLLNPTGERIGERIDRVLFCWDGDHKRDKGNRKPKPSGYHETKERLMEVLTEVLGAPSAVPKAHEADDAVGTVVYKVYEQARKVYVVSGDKDLMQLQGGNVHYYSLVDQCLCSSTFICRRFHIHKPSQLAIALAIKGDSTDNIKGIKGWGEKKVQSLFKSVAPGMNFQSALDCITRQIPENAQDDFWESLDRTLLATDVPDMPEPAPLKFARLRVVDDLDLPGVTESYNRLLNAYEGSSSGDDEDV